MAVATKPRQEASILANHHPVGLSTGFMSEARGDWDKQVTQALDFSPFAAELSALSERELPSLMDFVDRSDELPFRYLSIHGPSKDLGWQEQELVANLVKLAEHCDAIVMHPDTMEKPELYGELGRKLVIENMDARKAAGRTAEEIEPLFAKLPEAGFCFDIAHAWSIDSDMGAASDLLDAFSDRLRHVHLSSLSEDLHHITLTNEHEELFRQWLERCVDVPWILEAPPRQA